MTCKYKKICKEFDKNSIICKENGSYSFDKKANCFKEMERKK
jgi:hypothetical protein